MLTEEKEYDPLGALGIDMRIDSDKEILENKQVEDIGRKYFSSGILGV